MKVYEKSSTIRCDIHDLFAFHLDLGNLVAITPKDTSVKLVGELFTPKEGSVITLDTRKNFIPLRWRVQIAELKEPNLLVDLALQSPFKFWKHSHIFSTMEDGTSLLCDRVEYELPFGFLGRLLEGFVYDELDKMFTYRHEVTRTILEGKK